MAKQNVFDNAVFFEEYKKLREKDVNANTLFEIPALLSMMPDLDGKSVLDLGCGFGEHCKMFIERGAAKVLGVDISTKMLEIAKHENADPKIEYLNMAIEDISTLNESFDVVVSSLAFHYIEDFHGVIQSIYSKLNENGVVLFSQEHPLVTCHCGKDRWTRNENGEKIHLNVTNYAIEGERSATWFIDGIKIYHRTFSNILNTLIKAGFTIEQLIEPSPTQETLKNYPEHKDLFHKPDFLLIKAKKLIKSQK